MILVLEYMEGGELYTQVGQRERLTERQVRYDLLECRDYMRVIVDAVRYCHEMNIVHRDIKVSLFDILLGICCVNKAIKFTID